MILTNNESLVEDLIVGETLGNSDHAIIRFGIKCNLEKRVETLNFVPNFAKGNYDAIRSFLKDVKWTSMIKGKNAQEMWNAFKKLLTEAQNRFIPMRRQQRGRFLKRIWFNLRVNKCFKEKKKHTVNSELTHRLRERQLI